LNLAIAREELRAIIKHWPMWFILGTQDIQLRYRRSTLGPFWITISMAVSIYCMGFLYGHLFKMELNHYFPYLASGIISWAYISTLILEGSNVFIESEGYIKNQESYMSIFVMRMVLRNSIIFVHNLIVFIPILFVCHVGLSFKLLLILPGLFIIWINVMTWGTVIAILGTRYRDFAQIVVSLVQIIFFLTPIMWMPSLLPDRYQWLVTINPFYQFLGLIRAPLLNTTLNVESILMIAGVSILGFILYGVFLQRYKSRIVFWI
jgi:ABC-type polysaccharide/polyol phosphate export permease